MKQIKAIPRRTIQLGHRGENEAREIIFDLTEYIDTYGPGTARLLHHRDGEPAPYIVPAVQDGGTLIWAVIDADTAAPGDGSAELQWTVNNVLAKSDIWNTKTKAALDDGATEPPTGAEGWYQQLVAYIDSLRGAGVSEEQIAAAVEAYLLEHPVDVPVQSVNGQTGEVLLTAADVGALAQADLQTGVDTALAQAKASGEFDGAQGPQGEKGDKGDKGDTGAQGPAGPQGEKGDTGAQGPAGEQGPQGIQGDTGPQGEQGQKGDKGDTGETGPAGADGAPGADGKSAYQYAQEGGYTGTEEEFAAKLAEEMPDKLPNPNALTFTGAVEGSYDGSAPLEVEIPSGGSVTGGDDWKLILDTTIPAGASVHQYSLPKAMNNYKELFFEFYVKAESATINICSGHVTAASGVNRMGNAMSGTNRLCGVHIRKIADMALMIDAATGTYAGIAATWFSGSGRMLRPMPTTENFTILASVEITEENYLRVYGVE